MGIYINKDKARDESVEKEKRELVWKIHTKWKDFKRVEKKKEKSDILA